MSCVREASPPLQDTDHPRHDIKKKRFLQPWRGIRRIFRRKDRPVISEGVDVVTATLRSSKENFESEQEVEATNLEPAKSHSTSHLTDDTTDNSQRRSLQSTLLSVSHDSVFTSEQRSPDSGSETSLYTHSRLGFPNSSVQAELIEVIRRRRVYNASDDEDLGLPRSPVSNSPTTADDMFTKEHIVTKSSQSTCSDGSLLSMGSSEIDEESYYHSSRHSSKLSLYEKRISSGSDLFSINDKSSSANASLTSNSGTSLSHSAAKHKMAVKPKRNHGAPHKKRQIITSNTLPTTPEVNEENSHKVLPPEEKPSVVADSGQSDEHEPNANTVPNVQAHPRTAAVENHTSVTQINAPMACSTPHSKCSSLPPGVSLSPVPSFKLLTRSKSNVVAPLAADEDETVVSAEKDSKKDENGSFFSRLLLRRSSKKKQKNSPDEQDASNPTVESESSEWKVRSIENIVEERSDAPSSYVNGLNNAMKHHPLFRQRVEPLNLPNMEVALGGRMHTSMVPINVTDDEMKASVKKSHSFRNREKLPYSCYEDTPSLPVNIGLVEEERATERFSKNFRKSRPEPNKHSVTEEPAKSENDGPAEAAFKADTKWKPAVPAKLDYSNISVVNGNKVNISLGDGGKNEKSIDIKVPVPAPRTSLLNKSNEALDTSSVSSREDDDVDKEPETAFNIVMTESSGQRSIVSIGSVEMNSEPSSPLVDSVFEPIDFDKPEQPIEEPRPVTPVEKIETPNDPVEPVRPRTPETPVPEMEEPFEVDEPKPKDTKIEIPDKPIVITDFANGIVKVNDTTVVMRRKTKDVSHSKDDEPELMKVFARRSLKLKETDNVDEMIDNAVKSRDSDKENEDSNSLPDERKKNEIKIDPPKNAFKQFQRSLSHDVETNKNAVLTSNGNEKRQRCKSTSHEKEPCSKPPPAIISNGDEKVDKIEVIENKEDKVNTSGFKRIQQRREEWEKRAQQAMKVRGNK